MSLDLLLINPGAAHGIKGGHSIYGELGNELTAIEPPLWCRLIAGYVRDRGHSVAILDAEAQNLRPEDVAGKVRMLRPRLACIAAYGHQPSASTQQMAAAGAIAREIKQRVLEYQPVMILGGHVSALPERTMREETVDYACVGEGPITVERLLQHGLITDAQKASIPGLVWRSGNLQNMVVNPSAPLIEDMAQLHGDAWDLLPMKLYRAHNWQCFDNLAERQPYASIYTSLGCPYKCLAGDVEVNTIYGRFPIKRLAECFGDTGVPVYTYDPATGQAFIADGIKIRKYGVDQELMRVHFDNGTHLDCTPDHGFMQFKWGNGKSESSQWECEAKDLTPGAHVRALRMEHHPEGRIYVTWARRARKLRQLLGSEQVHHDDRNKSNDHPSNLDLCGSTAEHFLRHPEIAERMRISNPTRDGMSDEWIAKIAAANRGKTRSPASRLRYRESKLGKLNPNFKHGHRVGTASRLEVNHRIVRIERLHQRGDVYCLTVPQTGWFFANDVLVKNCSFCCINSPFQSNRYRMREPGHVVAEIASLYDRHNIRTFKITDEMFVLNEAHYTAIADGLIINGLGSKINIWAYARVDTVKPERLALLRKAGIRWLALGIESGSAHVRDGANKKFRNDDIIGVVRAIQRAGINVIGNFIVGLPDDTHETMEQTYQLAAETNCEFMNVYSAQAYPGSRLYDEAVATNAALPSSWRGYSQHNDDCRPLDTKYIRGKDVLAFRDQFFSRYFSRPEYTHMVAEKFGAETVAHIEKMLEYKLPRKLLTGELV